MATFYLICAIFGGVILLMQFAMLLLGLGGGEGADGFDGGLDGDAGIDLPDDVGTDIDGGDFDGDGHHHAAHDAGMWIFRVVSFQTIVAAFAFFGIAGRAGLAGGLDPLPTLGLAIVAGLGAMYAVYHLVGLMHRFNADGTVRIARAVGQVATVYIPIPGEGTGAGKVQVGLPSGTLELEAVTDGDRLPSGARVRVLAVVDRETVRVEPLASDSADRAHVSEGTSSVR